MNRSLSVSVWLSVPPAVINRVCSTMEPWKESTLAAPPEASKVLREQSLELANSENESLFLSFMCSLCIRRRFMPTGADVGGEFRF